MSPTMSPALIQDWLHRNGHVDGFHKLHQILQQAAQPVGERFTQQSTGDLALDLYTTLYLALNGGQCLVDQYAHKKSMQGQMSLFDSPAASATPSAGGSGQEQVQLHPHAPKGPHGGQFVRKTDPNSLQNLGESAQVARKPDSDSPAGTTGSTPGGTQALTGGQGNESDMDKSHREWEENWDAVMGNPDKATDRNLLRARSYGDWLERRYREQDKTELADGVLSEVDNISRIVREREATAAPVPAKPAKKRGKKAEPATAAAPKPEAPAATPANGVVVYRVPATGKPMALRDALEKELAKKELAKQAADPVPPESAPAPSGQPALTGGQAKPREVWQMPLKEYAQVMHERLRPLSKSGKTWDQWLAAGVPEQDLIHLSGAGHEVYVKDALEKGGPVPPEVLADYPDLKKADHIADSSKMVDHPGGATEMIEPKPITGLAATHQGGGNYLQRGTQIRFTEGEHKGYVATVTGTIQARYRKEPVTYRIELEGLKGGLGQTTVTADQLMRQAVRHEQPDHIARANNMVGDAETPASEHLMRLRTQRAKVASMTPDEVSKAKRDAGQFADRRLPEVQKKRMLDDLDHQIERQAQVDREVAQLKAGQERQRAPGAESTAPVEFQVSDEERAKFLRDMGWEQPERHSLRHSLTTALRYALRSDAAPERYVERENQDYAGEHAAPMSDSGSPAHELTANGTYPDDVYSPHAVRYYGDGSEHDAHSFGIVHALRNRPQAKVRVYRAVPLSVEDQIAGHEQRKTQILKRGGAPGEYDRADAAIQRLKTLPPQKPLGINRGDWVTINKQYAHSHGKSALNGQYRVLSKVVPASHIYTNGDSIHEWGYDPGEPDDRHAQAFADACVARYCGKTCVVDQYAKSGFSSAPLDDSPGQLHFGFGSAKPRPQRQWTQEDERQHPREQAGRWGTKKAGQQDEHVLPLFEAAKDNANIALGNTDVQLKKQVANNNRMLDEGVPNTAPTPDLPRPAHRMTGREFAQHSGQPTRFESDRLHRQYIKNAIEAGEPVPDHVLREHPDLAEHAENRRRQAAFMGTTGELPSHWQHDPTPPKDEGQYVDGDEHNRKLVQFYRDRKASSRETPSELPNPPVGTWRMDKHFGIYGREIEQLRMLPVHALTLSEDDYTDPKQNAEGRGDDARRYAGWMREFGLEHLPPIHVVETDDGTHRVMNGHRRTAAAKLAEHTHIPAWVSPRMSTGKKYYGQDKDIGTGLTYEGAHHGVEKASEMYKERQRAMMSQHAQAGQPERYVEHPATNPDHPDHPAFKKWFGKSKVTHAETGKPLVVYHGSDQDIREFEPAKSDELGAVFFSPSPKYAAAHAAIVKGAEEGHVNPSYLSLQNPMIVRGGDRFSYRSWEAQQVQAAKRKGHDGLVLIGPKQTFYAVFHPHQAKRTDHNFTIAREPNAQDQYTAESEFQFGATRSWEDVAEEIHQTAKQHPQLNPDAPIAKGGREFGLHWMDSDRFHLADVPLDKIDWRPGHMSQYKDHPPARTKGPIVIETNRRKVGFADDEHRLPKVTVLDGQHRLYQARQEGQKSIRAWVGDQAMKHIGVVIRPEQYAAAAQTAGDVEKLPSPYAESGGVRAPLAAATKDTGVTAPPLHHTQTPEFTTWFGDREAEPHKASKVLHPETGQPRIVHHASNEQFDAFDPSRIGATRDPGWLGHGFYFSSDPNVNKNLDGTRRERNRVDVYLNLRNPLSLQATDWKKTKWYHIREALGLPEAKQVTPEAAREVTNALKKRGHDGVVYDYTPTGWRHQEYMAMHPEQIKRVTNRGTWDPADERMDYDQQGEAPAISDIGTELYSALRAALTGVDLERYARPESPGQKHFGFDAPEATTTPVGAQGKAALPSERTLHAVDTGYHKEQATQREAKSRSRPYQISDQGVTLGPVEKLAQRFSDLIAEHYAGGQQQHLWGADQEQQHPRGQPENKGWFAKKQQAAAATPVAWDAPVVQPPDLPGQIHLWGDDDDTAQLVPAQPPVASGTKPTSSTGDVGPERPRVPAALPAKTRSNEQLVAAYKAGDREAGNQLARQNEGLVAKVARKWAKREDQVPDLMQEGFMALLKAAEEFDPARGTQFSTLAQTYIQTRLHTLTRSQKRAGEPVAASVLDVDDDDRPQLDPAAGHEPDPLEMSERKNRLLAAIENLLPPKTAELVKRRAGLAGYQPHTDAQLAKGLGVSRARINKVYNEALARLHAHLRESELYTLRATTTTNGSDNLVERFTQAFGRALQPDRYAFGFLKGLLGGTRPAAPAADEAPVVEAELVAPRHDEFKGADQPIRDAHALLAKVQDHQGLYADAHRVVDHQIRNRYPQFVHGGKGVVKDPAYQREYAARIEPAVQGFHGQLRTAATQAVGAAKQSLVPHHQQIVAGYQASQAKALRAGKLLDQQADHPEGLKLLDEARSLLGHTRARHYYFNGHVRRLDEGLQAAAQPPPKWDADTQAPWAKPKSATPPSSKPADVDASGAAEQRTTTAAGARKTQADVNRAKNHVNILNRLGAIIPQGDVNDPQHRQNLATAVDKARADQPFKTKAAGHVRLLEKLGVPVPEHPDNHPDPLSDPEYRQRLSEMAQDEHAKYVKNRQQGRSQRLQRESEPAPSQRPPTDSAGWAQHAERAVRDFASPARHADLARSLAHQQMRRDMPGLSTAERTKSKSFPAYVAHAKQAAHARLKTAAQDTLDEAEQWHQAQGLALPPEFARLRAAHAQQQAPKQPTGYEDAVPTATVTNAAGAQATVGELQAATKQKRKQEATRQRRAQRQEEGTQQQQQIATAAQTVGLAPPAYLQAAEQVMRQDPVLADKWATRRSLHDAREKAKQVLGNRLRDHKLREAGGQVGAQVKQSKDQHLTEEQARNLDELLGDTSHPAWSDELATRLDADYGLGWGHNEAQDVGAKASGEYQQHANEKLWNLLTSRPQYGPHLPEWHQDITEALVRQGYIRPDEPAVPRERQAGDEQETEYEREERERRARQAAEEGRKNAEYEEVPFAARTSGDLALDLYTSLYMGLNGGMCLLEQYAGRSRKPVQGQKSLFGDDEHDVSQESRDESGRWTAGANAGKASESSSPPVAPADSVATIGPSGWPKETEGSAMLQKPAGIEWTAPANVQGIGGKTLKGGTPLTQNGELLVDFGTQKIQGQNRALKVRVGDKPELAEKVQEYEAAMKAFQEAEQRTRAQEVDDLRSGKTPIKASYHDGEYLSGHTVHGPAADLLIKLGIAKEVSGWGVHVEHGLIDSLGQEFTYPQAVEYARPRLEAAQAKQDAAKQARDAKFSEAKQTGKPVVLRSWTETRRAKEGGEWGEYQFAVTEYAKPDGTTETKAINTY